MFTVGSLAVSFVRLFLTYQYYFCTTVLVLILLPFQPLTEMVLYYLNIWSAGFCSFILLLLQTCTVLPLRWSSPLESFLRCFKVWEVKESVWRIQRHVTCGFGWCDVKEGKRKWVQRRWSLVFKEPAAVHILVSTRRPRWCMFLISWESKGIKQLEYIWDISV